MFKLVGSWINERNIRKHLREKAQDALNLGLLNSYIDLIEIGYQPYQTDEDKIQEHFKNAMQEKNFSKLLTILKLPNLNFSFIIGEMFTNEYFFNIWWKEYKRHEVVIEYPESLVFLDKIQELLNKKENKNLFKNYWFFNLGFQINQSIIHKKGIAQDASRFGCIYEKSLNNTREFLEFNDLGEIEKYLKEVIILKARIKEISTSNYHYYHVNVSKAIVNIEAFLVESYEKFKLKKQEVRHPITGFTEHKVTEKLNDLRAIGQQLFTKHECIKYIPEDYKELSQTIYDKILRVAQFNDTTTQNAHILTLENTMTTQLEFLMSTFLELAKENEKEEIEEFKQGQVLIVKTLQSLDVLLKEILQGFYEQKIHDLKVGSELLKEKSIKLV